MKTKIITATLSLILAAPMVAQDRTTVNAMSREISDNLDLRAVASIFGDSRNLEDFEQRLNDPGTQISNLDLNNDNRVDYLRVVESVQDDTHLIVVQSVLGLDTYQDVATIEVERDRNNQVSVQVVGDVYMYGANYIYEPVYVTRPVIFTSFWVHHYRPYCSSWRWGYYPSYYYAWRPFPVFRYRNNIQVHINFSHHYNYVNARRSAVAVAMYTPRRANYCEVKYPTRSFAYRNNNVRNRYELDQTRNLRNGSANNQLAYGNTRGIERNNATTRNENGRSHSNPTRNYSNTRPETGNRNHSATRENNPVRTPDTRMQNDRRNEYGNVGTPANGSRNEPLREKSGSRNQARNYSNPVRSFDNQPTENSIRMSPNIGRSESRTDRNPSARMENARSGNSNRANAPQQNRAQQNGRNNSERGDRR